MGIGSWHWLQLVRKDGEWRVQKEFYLDALGSDCANFASQTLVEGGTYPKVVGALPKLQPGDIVGYQLKGTITHVSIITGKDFAGLPVVAAHTADRFRNPWDLGWDKQTVYWILHLRD